VTPGALGPSAARGPARAVGAGTDARPGRVGDDRRTPPCSGGIAAVDPAWSPDGRRLAFGSAVVLPSWYPGEIMVARSDGSGLRSVTRTRAIGESDPAWLAPAGSTGDLR
jgi:hypothetical protein